MTQQLFRWGVAVTANPDRFRHQPPQAAQPLTALERDETPAGIERREPDHVIARHLGRHRVTINAVINRNGGRVDYTATGARARAVAQRSRPKATTFMAFRGRWR